MIVRTFGGIDRYPYCEVSTMDKPMAESRGILLATVIGAATWIAIGLLLWWLL